MTDAEKEAVKGFEVGVRVILKPCGKPKLDELYAGRNGVVVGYHFEADGVKVCVASEKMDARRGIKPFQRCWAIDKLKKI